MKPMMLCTAVLCLAASGCANLACRDCGQAGHVVRSQVAPRPTITRTTLHDGDISLLNRHRKCKLPGICAMGKNRGGTLACADCDGDYCDSCDGDASCYGNEAGSCENGGCYDDSQCGAGSCRGTRGGQGCQDCRLGRSLCPHSGGYPERTMFQPGPPVGQVAYPYYTVRGPRDFLQDNPPSIGPY